MKVHFNQFNKLHLGIFNMGDSTTFCYFSIQCSHTLQHCRVKKKHNQTQPLKKKKHTHLPSFYFFNLFKIANLHNRGKKEAVVITYNPLLVVLGSKAPEHR